MIACLSFEEEKKVQRCFRKIQTLVCMSKPLAPIVLFVYNRPRHTEQTLMALSENELAADSLLYIYADGFQENGTEEDALKVEQVRRCIASQQGFAEVKLIFREKNLGLAQNIIQGITEVVNRHGKVIVLEDDLLTSPGFLKYMNEALDFYAQEECVMHINAYMYPIGKHFPETFFYNVISSWGWGTWERAWKYFRPDAAALWSELDQQEKLYHFDLNGSNTFVRHLERNITGEIDTWAIKWLASVYLKEGFCLCPRQSLIQNIGFDGSGTHSNTIKMHDISQLAKEISIKPIILQEYNGIRNKMRAFYRYGGVSWRHKANYYWQYSKGRIYQKMPSFLKRIYKKITW